MLNLKSYLNPKPYINTKTVTSACVGRGRGSKEICGNMEKLRLLHLDNIKSFQVLPSPPLQSAIA